MGNWAAGDEDDMRRIIDEQGQRFRVALLAGALLVGCADEPAQPPPPAMDAAAVDASLDAAERYLATGNPVEAEAIAARLADAVPTHHGPHELLGRLDVRRAVQLRSAGREDEAVSMFAQAYAHYELAVRCAPDISGLQQSAGEIAQHASLPDFAVSHYLAAAELEPENSRAPLYIAQILVADGQFDRAHHWIEQVLAIDPAQPHALATLAVLEMEQGNWPGAFEAIERGRAAQPDDLGLRVVEARLHRRNGDSTRALELLMSLSESKRSDEAVTSELALNWIAIGRPERAAESWTRCFAGQGDSQRSGHIAIEAARAWIGAGSMEQASIWLDKAALLGVPGERIEAVRMSIPGRDDQD